MTIEFKVGDNIWWLDTRFKEHKPTIKLNIILDIKVEACGGYGYVIDDNYNTCIWSPTFVVAKTKEELIDLLYPPKIGRFDNNQFVYIIETNGRSIGINVISSLVIDKGYIKQFDNNNQQYLVGVNKDNRNGVVWYDAASTYATINTAKHAINKWLNNNNDN